ncbi:arylsulfatase H-like isoform X3 [Portunus trituberculatus]|uniref:arylsulfatase H-like isoform X3 n=1 Tax=Portunus trituberculatus TaxID=210409 RepID=UPI001E1CD66C|nr:arylsulfatase H-like isoform X3 [Portunus trituberculatus]
MMRVFAWIWLVCAAAVSVSAKRPNVLLFLADDLGIGDLGCYGNTTIKTPHIDRLASDGVRLTHHLAAAAMCTPSRAALLTARYPVRYGLEEGPEDYLLPVILHITSQSGLPADEITIASALTAANYTTGLVGKWHLGMNCTLFGRSCPGPLNYGFQSFYGIPVTLFQEFRGLHAFWKFPLHDRRFQGLAVAWMTAMVSLFLARRRKVLGSCTGVLLLMATHLLLGGLWFTFAHYSKNSESRWGVSPWLFKYANSRLFRNDQVVEAPIELDGLSQRLVEESRRFLEAHARDEKPFFLMHSFGHVHTPMFSAPHMAGRSKHGRYGDNVEEMDDSVGKVLATLAELGLEDNTVVYFTSDQGGHLEAVEDTGERIGGHNGRFKGGKRQGGSEGGIRVPGIFRWPGHIPRGVTLDTPTSLMDLMPTLLSLAGLPRVHTLVPQAMNKELDGEDISELLLKGAKGSKTPRLFLHHCGTSLHAVRMVSGDHVYKMHLAKPKWWKGSTQCGWHHTTGCDCHGPNVTDLSSQPELYDLLSDPYEDYPPISPDSSEYKSVVHDLKEYVRQWKERVTLPPSQLTTLANALWKPFYQPHCHTC